MNKTTFNHPTTNDIKLFSISELNKLAKHTLEQGIGHIWLTGEISNLSKPSSGHIYFTLKDKTAQIRCAMFRLAHSKIEFDIENGKSVLAQAKVSLYEARGDYQLIINEIHLSGDGQLQLQFEKSKKKLAALGLFDLANKKTLPRNPACIGIVSSPTGAAIHDVLSVLKRRYPLAPIILYPTQVQGKVAAANIIQALETANEQRNCDVLILTRGGGSLEDLWCFNTEELAHCINDSAIPIITGIGHEIDTTIADLVSDQRAPTPSAAAEYVSPDQTEWKQQLSEKYCNLIYAIKNRITNFHSIIQSHQYRLKHPKEELNRHAQQLDLLEMKLQHTINTKLKLRRSQLSALTGQLNTLNPLTTLERGYTICFSSDNKLVHSYKSVIKNESLKIRFNDGEAHVLVRKTNQLNNTVSLQACLPPETEGSSTLD